jgi:hypothetical protein
LWTSGPVTNGLVGSEVRNKAMLAVNRTVNSIPAIAAARGVVNS